MVCLIIQKKKIRRHMVWVSLIFSILMKSIGFFTPLLLLTRVIRSLRSGRLGTMFLLIGRLIMIRRQIFHQKFLLGRVLLVLFTRIVRRLVRRLRLLLGRLKVFTFFLRFLLVVWFIRVLRMSRLIVLLFTLMIILMICRLLWRLVSILCRFGLFRSRRLRIWRISCLKSTLMIRSRSVVARRLLRIVTLLVKPYRARVIVLLTTLLSFLIRSIIRFLVNLLSRIARVVLDIYRTQGGVPSRTLVLLVLVLLFV